MSLGCITALIAQFYPKVFPDNRILLGICAFFYFGISGILQFMTMVLDQDIMYIGYGSKKVNNNNNTSTSATLTTKDKNQKFMFRSTMPRDSDKYTLILEKPIGKQIIKWEDSVGNYFTSNGEFAEQIYYDKIQEIFGSALNSTVSKN